jgi:hypothetical protein
MVLWCMREESAGTPYRNESRWVVADVEIREDRELIEAGAVTRGKDIERRWKKTRRGKGRRHQSPRDPML